jgi:beta-mannosidase
MKRIYFFALALFFIPGAFSQNSISLSGKWKVVWNDGNKGYNDVPAFIHFNPMLDSVRYVEVEVPMDLNLAMQKRGMFGDINLGVNTLSARWVSQQYWQYYRHFTVPKEVLNKTTWLVFDRLDYNATILVNGELAGTHNNAYIPCRIDVTGKLKEGDNLLTVAVESGLFGVADKEGNAYNNALSTILNKRHWLRKPQYQFSWDWSPNMINVGITGDVRLEWKETARLDQIVTYVKMSDDLSSAELTIRPFIQGLNAKSDLTVEATLLENNQKVSVQDTISKTLRPFELKMHVTSPKLWWPVGHGSQALYTVKIEIKENGKVIDSGSRRFGFRKIEIDRSAHPVAGNYFTVKVNNQKVFMKGGDWVPADMIYSSVTKKRLEKLVDLAVAANLNILRIWGGGEFAGNDLLDLCDEKGLLVWHDFLFACAEYPGDNLDFYNNIKKEVTWAVREFAHHPSLIIWSGNNELEWGTFSWGYDTRGKIVPDYILYHHLIPVIVKKENPVAFYWASSPYAENYEQPNTPFTGDQHPWGVSLAGDGPDFYAYRHYVDRFPNEGGFLGASTPATLRQFLPKDEQFVRSVSWDHHDNEVNFWGDKDVTYSAIEFWLGKSFRQMTMDEYAFASGLLQAEALTEYISNYHRRMFSSSSAIFWMYNDCWPTTHGWTIVDYYNRKKLAYHPVRRAFEPVSVVVATDSGKINIYGINDGAADWKGKLQFGIFENGGGYTMNENKEVILPANASTVITSFDASAYEKAGYDNHGAFAVLKSNDIPVSQYKMLMNKFRDIKLEKPQISILYKDEYAVLNSSVFVWGACIDLDGDLPVKDNCFDLLPGIPYYVKINKGEKISVKQTGNDLMLKLQTIELR